MLMSKLLQKQIIGEKLTQEQILEKIVKIQSSGIRMNRLIQDLLDVSRSGIPKEIFGIQSPNAA